MPTEQSYYLSLEVEGNNVCRTDRRLVINCTGVCVLPRPFETRLLAGREDYYLQYLVKGEMRVWLDGEERLMQPGQAVDVAGTCSMFCVSTSGIIPELSRRGAGLIFNSGTLPDTYFYWGYIRTGGLALRWFKDNVCGQEKDGDYYQTLSRQAECVPAGAGGVLFLPYLPAA